MNHENFENALLLRAAGELADRESTELAGHLAGCAACRSFAGALEASSAAAKSVMEDPNPDLVRKTRSHILAPETRPQPFLPWNWIPAGLGLALATLLLMVGRQRPGPTAGPAPSASASEDRDELSRIETDLEELEELISDVELDLSETVTGGDL